MERTPLPGNFRKLSVTGRRDALRSACALSDSDLTGFGTDPDMLERADVMVEHAVGYVAVPLGVAPGIVIDNTPRDIPMATEEPSVVAAASFAGAMVSRAGGFLTETTEPVMIAQIYLHGARADALSRIEAAEQAIREATAPVLKRMEARGGGVRRVTVSRLQQTGVVRVHLHIDVRDAMGANILNSTAEACRELLERLSGGSVVMAILSNSAEERRAVARFSLPVSLLARRGFSGEQVAAGVVEAAAIADEDPDRAVTHNKGIMNGISALALATGNDTRAIEAAAHRYAARSGSYRALSTFDLDGAHLSGTIELPVPFGVVGGALGIHPTARASLALLGSPDARTLGAIAAALGLAQNLAALSALVSEGIQMGHMRLHARRLAFEAGARGNQVRAVSERLQEMRLYDPESAAQILREVRGDD